MSTLSSVNAIRTISTFTFVHQDQLYGDHISAELIPILIVHYISCLLRLHLSNQ